MRQRLFATIGLLFATLAPTSSWAVRIGVFFDTEATTCSAQVPMNTQGTCWVVAILDEAPDDRLIGAEFKLTGFPSSWFGSWSPSNQASMSVGNPLIAGGAVAFPICKLGARRLVVLGSVLFFATTSESVTLQVVAPDRNSNPGMSCPAIAHCDETDRCAPGLFVPKLTLECVEGLTAYVNGGPCTVDAEGQGVVTSRLTIGPNPAVGNATFRVDLPRRSELVFEIYDVAGRRVRRFYGGMAGPGHHIVRWNGRDDAGQPLPSGLYFVGLDAVGAQRGRLTLVR